MANGAPQMAKADKPKLGMASAIIHCTSMIRCTNEKGQQSSGTAFLFEFLKGDGKSTSCLVTNKHVVAGASLGQIVFTLEKDGLPNYGNNITVEFSDFGQQWIGHPQKNIDLAVLPIVPTLNSLIDQHKKPFMISLDESLIPTKEQRNQLTPLEDLLIVGYPDGMIDLKNNTPISKRGMTATPPNIDFDGEPKFLIDAAIFPGSSGSPCFIYNAGTIPQSDGGVAIGSRILLLGVVFAVAQHEVDGNIRLVPAPTQLIPMATSLIPNNVGVCINSDKILDFEPVLLTKGAILPSGYKMRAAIP